MLLPSYLSNVANKAVDLWESLNLFAVRSMARKIADAGNHMTGGADYQKRILINSGKCLEEIKAETKAILRESNQVIEDIFSEALQNSYDNDAEIFAQAGVKSDPYATKQGQKFIQSLYEQTNGTLYNYSQTLANGCQTTFIKACDDALTRVRSGLQSPEQAIRDAIEDAARAGAYVTYPSGRIETVEVAVRRAVMTGVNQVSLQQCIDECERMGTNYVIVSSHLGARVSDKDAHANHAGWQGGIYRIEYREKDFWGPLEHLNGKYNMSSYAMLEDATGYPNDPTGLGGYNCRHTMYPYIPGISENHMQVFDEDENRDKYEATQKQRAMERAMREERREIEALKEAYKTAKTPEIKSALELHRAAYKDMRDVYETFCSRHGLSEQLNRTYTAAT